MSYRIIAILITSVFLMGIPSYAKGNDDSGLSDKTTVKNDNGNRIKEHNREKTQNGEIDGVKTQTKDQIRTRDMIKLQIETCTKLSEEIKNQSKISVKDQSKNQNQVKEKIRIMLKTNNDVENSLTDGEKELVKSQIFEMNRIRTKLEEQVRSIEQNKDNTGKNAVIIKNAEKEINKLENHYRAMLWTLNN